jgi:molybdopterin molybdotransferase
LRVAILSSGDELIEPGAVPREGSVFDANRYILHSLLQGLPVQPADLGILPDEPAAVGTALERAAQSHDVILASGGASRGAEDHVVRSVAERGRLDFWQIAMKPGRPLAFGRLGEAVFIGLPGNPVAAMVCFLLFARPVLLRLGGAGWNPPRAFAVPAGFASRKKPGRSEYLRATLREDAERGLVAQRIEREGSGILTSMVEAQGLVELPPEVERVAEGEPVRFLSFPELGIPA